MPMKLSALMSASVAVAARIRAIAAAPSARVIFQLSMVSSRSAAGVCRRSFRERTPPAADYSGPSVRAEMSLFVEIGLDQRTQFRRHFRLDAEPQFEAAHRLMQQHAEAIGRAQAAFPRRC